MAEKKSMADVWKEMNKQYGDEGMFVGNDIAQKDVDSIPTGSHLIDDAIGTWGVCRGLIVQYAGFPSTCKSLLALSTIAQYQKQNPEGWCMYCDAEYTFDPIWTAGLGVDLSRLMVYKENNGVKIFERLVGQSSKTPGKKTKPGILDIEKESGGTGLGIIVIDSVAAITPPVEEVANVGGATMAAMARFLPPELRRITPLLADTGVTLIAVNQLREKPGVMYGDPTVSSGGNALKFACSLMVHLAKMTGADSRIENCDEQTGAKFRFKIEKNKVAPAFKSGEFTVDFLHGIINQNEELRELGCKYGVIQRPNNRTYVYKENKYCSREEINSFLLDENVQKKILVEIKEAKKTHKTLEEVVENNSENVVENE